jgi:hypothetical protein
MPRRSKVELYEQIRRAHSRDELSIRELARRFPVHRRDVQAALSSPVPLPRKNPVVRLAPVLGPWKATIDGWLAADRTTSNAHIIETGNESYRLRTHPNPPPQDRLTTGPHGRLRVGPEPVSTVGPIRLTPG